MKIRLGLNLFAKEVLVYLLTMILGLTIAYRFFNNIISPANKFVPIEYGEKDLILFSLVVVALLLISRNQKISKWFYRIFLVIFVYGGAQMIGDAFLSFPNSFYFALFVVVSFIFWRSVLMHDLALIFAIAGLVSIVGLSLSPKLAIIALVILSFYDIVAVYKTKHMVTMAKGMILSGAPFGFVIPIQWTGFLRSRNEAQEGMGNRFMLLGAGDVGLPLILMASSISYSIWAAVLIGVFSILGVFVTHLLFINQEKREPMAALPPIATFSILGYVLFIFLT